MSVEHSFESVANLGPLNKIGTAFSLRSNGLNVTIIAATVRSERILKGYGCKKIIYVAKSIHLQV